jgi:hypothetical protein
MSIQAKIKESNYWSKQAVKLQGMQEKYAEYSKIQKGL